MQQACFPWNTLNKHRYAVNTCNKATFYNTKGALIVEWQTKQAALSRATVQLWTTSQSTEADLQIKDSHLWPTGYMEKVQQP